MKLLHLVPTLDPQFGGVSEAVRLIVAVLAETSVVESEVLTLDEAGKGYLNNINVPVHAVGEGAQLGNYTKLLLPWLNSNLQKFDVVIINGIWSFHSFAVWKVAKRIKRGNSGQRCPLIYVMPHGMLDPYFQRVGSRWLKSLRNEIYWALIESRVVNDADGLLFTSETELLLARDTFNFYRPKKEYNVGFGIAEPPAQSSEMIEQFFMKCPDIRGQLYILFLGRIDRKKGVDLLVRAYIALTKETAASSARIPKLVLAGPVGDKSFYKKLNHLLAKYPDVKKNVIFPGMLYGYEKWGALLNCEAFILPSHQENFGIAVIEALACGKPVLISDQVNICGAIEKEAAGLVAKNNISGTTELLSKWLKLTPAQKIAMGSNAKVAFNKHFTIRKAAENIISVFGHHYEVDSTSVN